MAEPPVHWLRQLQEAGSPVPQLCSAEGLCKSQTSSGWLHLRPISYSIP